MHGAGLRRLLGYYQDNLTKMYHPIILNNEWTILWRFIFIFSLTTLGTIMNGFFVASFFIELNLRKIGNVYLACAGLADMIITTGVMPTALFVMISGMWEDSSLCYGLQFLTQTSACAYNLFLMMVSIESYTRLCMSRDCYERFLSIPIAFVSFMVFVISIGFSAVGVYLGMDYDYCTRENYGSYNFRLSTTVFLHGIPCLFTVLFLIWSSLGVLDNGRRFTNYKRSVLYDNDYSFANLNLACYLMFVAAWFPYLIIINLYPLTDDGNFYTCAWIGVSRSVITSFLYNGLNMNFKRAFANLFYYCFCKNSINMRFHNRHHRAMNQLVETGEIRVQLENPTNQERSLIGARDNPMEM